MTRAGPNGRSRPASAHLVLKVCCKSARQEMGKDTRKRETAISTALTPPNRSPAGAWRPHESPAGAPSPRVGWGTPIENMRPCVEPRDRPLPVFPVYPFLEAYECQTGLVISLAFAFHGRLSFSFPDLYLKHAMMDVHANRKTNSWPTILIQCTSAEISTHHFAN